MRLLLSVCFECQLGLNIGTILMNHHIERQQMLYSGGRNRRLTSDFDFSEQTRSMVIHLVDHCVVCVDEAWSDVKSECDGEWTECDDVRW